MHGRLAKHNELASDRQIIAHNHWLQHRTHMYARNVFVHMTQLYGIIAFWQMNGTPTCVALQRELAMTWINHLLYLIDRLRNWSLSQRQLYSRWHLQVVFFIWHIRWPQTYPKVSRSGVHQADMAASKVCHVCIFLLISLQHQQFSEVWSALFRSNAHVSFQPRPLRSSTTIQWL